MRVFVAKREIKKEKHKKARKTGKERDVQQKEGSQNITAMLPATVKGAVLSWVAMTSSFFRIQVHPVLHLPPHAAAVKAPSLS